jgi:hypothetical protein
MSALPASSSFPSDDINDNINYIHKVFEMYDNKVLKKRVLLVGTNYLLFHHHYYYFYYH